MQERGTAEEPLSLYILNDNSHKLCYRYEKYLFYFFKIVITKSIYKISFIHITNIMDRIIFIKEFSHNNRNIIFY